MALADLSPKKNAENGIEIPILHPVTDLPIGVFITVYGADSETFKAIQRKQTNHRLEQQAKKKGRANLTAEALEAEGMDLLVGCTKSWRTEQDVNGTVTLLPEIEMNQGEWLPCNPENARRLYDALPWMKEQVDQAIGDRANFLPVS